MIQVELAAGRIVAIALLRDGEADDARVLVGDARQHGLRILGRDQRFQQAADRGQPLARLAMFVRVAQRQRVQAVLRRQRVAGVGLAQRDAADAPGLARTGGQRRLVDRGQMRARKGAQAQVHDAGAQAGPVVDRPRHAGGQTAQARRMQPPYQFHSVPSCCRRFTGR